MSSRENSEEVVECDARLLHEALCVQSAPAVTVTITSCVTLFACTSTSLRLIVIASTTSGTSTDTDTYTDRGTSTDMSECSDDAAHALRSGRAVADAVAASERRRERTALEQHVVQRARRQRVPHAARVRLVAEQRRQRHRARKARRRHVLQREQVPVPTLAYSETRRDEWTHEWMPFTFKLKVND